MWLWVQWLSGHLGAPPALTLTHVCCLFDSPPPYLGSFTHPCTRRCGEDFRQECDAKHHTPGHVAESERAFRMQGFPGCVGCIDVVRCLQGTSVCWSPGVVRARAGVTCNFSSQRVLSVCLSLYTRLSLSVSLSHCHLLLSTLSIRLLCLDCICPL